MYGLKVGASGFEVVEVDFFEREAILRELAVETDEDDDNRAWCISCRDVRTDEPDTCCPECFAALTALSN